MAIVASVPRQSRQGVYITPSVVIGAGLEELLVKLNVSTATYNSIGRSVTMRLYVLDEVQGVWRLTGTSQWQTGAYTDPETGQVNPPPVLSPNVAGLQGRTVRAEFEIPVTMSVGATIETVP